MMKNSKRPASVPELRSAAAARHVVGECPRAGWYPIDIVAESVLESSPERLARDLGRLPGEQVDYVDVVDAEAFRRIVESFDPDARGGSGVPINEAHLPLLDEKASDRALGFVRAVATDGHELYGYLDLTTDGHRLINERAFYATSTEYPFRHYELIKDESSETEQLYRPTRLGGLALTNSPRHDQQSGLAQHNTTTKKDIMSSKANRKPAARKNSAASKPAADEPTKANGGPTEDPSKMNSDADPDASQMNMDSEDQEQLYRDLDVIAEMLGLGDEDDYDGEDIIEALKKVLAHRDDLEREVSGLTEEVAQLNSARERSSYSRPRYRGRYNSRRLPPSNASPASSSDVATRRREAVNSMRSKLGRDLTPAEFNRTWASVK